MVKGTEMFGKVLEFTKLCFLSNNNIIDAQTLANQRISIFLVQI